MKDQAEAFEVEVMPSARPLVVEDIGGEVPTVTVPAIRAVTTGEQGVGGSIDRLRQYATQSDRFARASLAMQVMAGFELLEIKAQSPYTRGGRRTPKSNPHDAGLTKNAHESAVLAKTAPSNPFDGWPTWETFLNQALQISADTAGRWMAMAENARPRLKKLDGWGSLVRDLMERPIADLNPDEVDVLSRAVAKITDGRTQLDFLQQLGIVKHPGNPKLGGNTGGRPSASAVIGDDKIKAAAIDDWATIERGIVGGGMSFTVLTDAEVEAQIEWLSRAIRVRHQWLETASAKRTPATIQTLGKILV
jgi:hypothetical protein